MLEKLSPFFPALLGFVGAVLVAAAGFWASYRQSNFNSEIRQKNEEISSLQNENINNITGGDSFAYVQFQIQPQDGQSLDASKRLLLAPVVIHKGKYPLYDVAARIVDVTEGHPFDTQKYCKAIQLGICLPER